MDQREPDLEYPKLTWPRVMLWLTALGALTGTYAVVCPASGNTPIANRVVAVCVLALVPAVLKLLWHLILVVQATLRRAQRFEVDIERIGLLNEGLLRAQDALDCLMRVLGGGKVHEVAYCYAYEDRAFIALRGKRGAAMAAGSRVIVIDTDTSLVMGEFRATKHADGEWLCEKGSYMDAVWLGYVMQNVGQRSLAPPGAVAVVVPAMSGDENGQ